MPVIADPVLKAVADRITALWTSVGSCPLSALNEEGQSPLANFLELEFPVRNEDIVADRVYRESGGIRFVIHVLSLDGVKQATGWVEELRNLFRGETFDSVVVSTVSPATFDRDNRRGAFYVLPFVAKYTYDRLV